MAKVRRNEPCPCGSGQKVKRCCGTIGAEERLERASVALAEALALATHFPRLRARGPGFEAWLQSAVSGPFDESLLERGVAMLGEAERERIVREYAAGEEEAWRSLTDDAGDEAAAVEALLVGAVAAAAAERLPLPPVRLWSLGLTDGFEPEEILAGALRAADLWSAVESVRLDEALARLDQGLDEDEYERAWDAAIAGTTERLSTAWHAERLVELVTRLRAALPFEGYLAASERVAEACEAFERDARVRGRLAALLLEDSLARLDEAPGDAASEAA